MKWYPIGLLTSPALRVRSFARLLSGRRWMLVIVRREEPTVTFERRPGA